MNTQPVITQFKREFWENKISFVVMPALVTLFIFLIVICASLYTGGVVNNSGIHFGIDTVNQPAETTLTNGAQIDTGSRTNNLQNGIAEVQNHPKAFDNMVMGAMYANCALLYLVFSIVLASYSLRCLFDDRKNRDILFWRSMPVSETTNVLVKLAMVILIAPVTMLVLNILITLVSIIAGLFLFGYFGINISFLISSVFHGQSLYIPFQIFYELLFSLLMALPFIGFAFFVSALAKKAPFFMFASPALLILVDVLLNKFWGINLGVVDLFKIYLGALAQVKSAFILQESFDFDRSMILPFIICVSVGAAFVAGAIWLRNHRYEI